MIDTRDMILMSYYQDRITELQGKIDKMQIKRRRAAHIIAELSNYLSRDEYVAVQIKASKDSEIRELRQEIKRLNLEAENMILPRLIEDIAVAIVLAAVVCLPVIIWFTMISS